MLLQTIVLDKTEIFFEMLVLEKGFGICEMYNVCC